MRWNSPYNSYYELQRHLGLEKQSQIDIDNRHKTHLCYGQQKPILFMNICWFDDFFFLFVSYAGHRLYI